MKKSNYYPILEKDIATTVRVFYTLVLCSIFYITFNENMNMLGKSSWDINGYLNFLSAFNLSQVFIVSFVGLIFSFGLILFCPLKLISKVAFFIFLFILLALSTRPHYVNHNYNIIIYSCFFSILVSNLYKCSKRNRVFVEKNFKLFMASFYLPFFFASLGKLKGMVVSILNGNFLDLYLNKNILANQLLGEMVFHNIYNDNANQLTYTYLAKILAANASHLFPLFYIGILFQLTAFWLALIFPKYTYVLGFFSAIFFIVTMIGNAYFFLASLLILTMSFMNPLNNFGFTSNDEILYRQ